MKDRGDYDCPDTDSRADKHSLPESVLPSHLSPYEGASYYSARNESPVQRVRGDVAPWRVAPWRKQRRPGRKPQDFAAGQQERHQLNLELGLPMHSPATFGLCDYALRVTANGNYDVAVHAYGGHSPQMNSVADPGGARADGVLHIEEQMGACRDLGGHRGGGQRRNH